MRYLLFYDSGLGGKFVADEFYKANKNENCLVFMDSKHAPYGNKSKKTLLNLAVKNIEKLRLTFDIKYIVIACNTLSSTVKFELENAFHLPIIFIEPVTNLPENSLLLATINTIKHNENIRKLKGVKLIGFRDLAKKIDTCRGDFDALLPYLKRKLGKFRGVKDVALSCTHYNHIKPQLKTILGDVTFQENTGALCKTLQKNLHMLGLQEKSGNDGEFVVIKN